MYRTARCRTLSHLSLSSQRGFASAVMITLLTMGSLYTLTSRLHGLNLSPQTAHDKRTAAVLSRAKLALIAYAAENDKRPGGLPCPDLNDDGEAELSCDAVAQRIGRLPWQTLKSGDLRDGAGERLWYSVSAGFRNDASNVINSDSEGEISSSLGDRLVATIIAPGSPLPTQQRTGARNAVAQYVESYRLAARPSFESSATSNDRIESLTREELMNVIEPVVAARLKSEIVPVIKAQYFDAWGAFPFAVPGSDPHGSNFKDVDLRDAIEGLLPATADAGWVRWDRASLAIRQVSGAGRVNTVDCDSSSVTELRCAIAYSGNVGLRLDVAMVNVGRALVRAPDASDLQIGNGTSATVTVSHGPVARDGSAQVSATMPLPLGTRVQISMRIPTYIPEVTIRRPLVSASHSWFVRNEWYRFVHYRIGASLSPGGMPLAEPTEATSALTISSQTGAVPRPISVPLCDTGRTTVKLGCS